MKPEDIDKLFKDRLGPSAPTPPADLWSRLQDRIETEMPAAQPAQEQKPRGGMYLSYSIAAAIALLLAVGVVFYNVQRGELPVDGMAGNSKQVAEQPLLITAPAPSPATGIAQHAAPAVTEAPVAKALPETAKPAVSEPAKPATKPSAGTIAKAAPATASKHQPSQKGAARPASAAHLIAQAEKPQQAQQLAAQQEGHSTNTGETTPAAFAANTVDMNAQPVEIIIKRAVAVQQAEEVDEMSGFEKKQKLAKNIFKQVRNLSNGERVELSELGINANKIALETQVGKQKISKVFNL